jgi:hypothetical protein
MVKPGVTALPARLRSAEDAAADLDEFGYKCARIPASQGGSVYLGGQ